MDTIQDKLKLPRSIAASPLNPVVKIVDLTYTTYEYILSERIWCLPNHLDWTAEVPQTFPYTVGISEC